MKLVFAPCRSLAATVRAGLALVAVLVLLLFVIADWRADDGTETRPSAPRAVGDLPAQAPAWLESVSRASYSPWGQLVARRVAGDIQQAVGSAVERWLDDPAAGARWYRLASMNGVAGAQYRLGLLYAQGRGIGRDADTAAQLLQAAASQGHADAQGVLAIAYLRGAGVPQNFGCAYMWVSLAVELKPGPGRRVRDMVAGMLSVERRSQAGAAIDACRSSRYADCPCRDLALRDDAMVTK